MFAFCSFGGRSAGQVKVLHLTSSIDGLQHTSAMQWLKSHTTNAALSINWRPFGQWNVSHVVGASEWRQHKSVQLFSPPAGTAELHFKSKTPFFVGRSTGHLNSRQCTSVSAGWQHWSAAQWLKSQTMRVALSNNLRPFGHWKPAHVVVPECEEQQRSSQLFSPPAGTAALQVSCAACSIDGRNSGQWYIAHVVSVGAFWQHWSAKQWLKSQLIKLAFVNSWRPFGHWNVEQLALVVWEAQHRVSQLLMPPAGTAALHLSCAFCSIEERKFGQWYCAHVVSVWAGWQHLSAVQWLKSQVSVAASGNSWRPFGHWNVEQFAVPEWLAQHKSSQLFMPPAGTAALHLSWAACSFDGRKSGQW
jgi:hypothetical protein